MTTTTSGPSRCAAPTRTRDGTATGAAVDTWRPRPVTTVDSGTFDTSQGTVHLILGGGGTSANLDIYGLDKADGDTQARVFIKPNRPVPSATPGVYARAGAEATEDAIWSARRDTATGYGIAVFDVDPGSRSGGQASITVTHYHALGADPVNPTTGVRGKPNRRLHRLRDLHPGPAALGQRLRLERALRTSSAGRRLEGLFQARASRRIEPSDFSRQRSCPAECGMRNAAECAAAQSGGPEVPVSGAVKG